MKLAKNLSIAAASLAVSVAAVSAKPAQAASVNFLSQVGGTYNYNVLATQANEILGRNSIISLSELAGVTGVIAGPGFGSVLFDSEAVNLTIKNATAPTSNGSPFAGLNFSIISSILQPGPVNFVTLNTNGLTSTGGKVTGPASVPEPMTIGGSLLAIGFGTWMKRKQAESAQKA